jgi:hypothetical protein
MFYHTYGESADATRELLKGVHPDFGIPLVERGVEEGADERRLFHAVADLWTR